MSGHGELRKAIERVAEDHADGEQGHYWVESMRDAVLAVFDEHTETEWVTIRRDGDMSWGHKRWASKEVAFSKQDDYWVAACRRVSAWVPVENETP